MLLDAWGSGSRGAGEDLLLRLLPGVYGLCYRLLRRSVDAQDATQETLTRLCDQVSRGARIRNVRSWIATVAMNHCIDLRRRPIAEPLQGAECEEFDTLARADAREIAARIPELPERYQMVLHLHFELDLAPHEIGAGMGLDGGTARVLLHRAISALRRQVMNRR